MNARNREKTDWDNEPGDPLMDIQDIADYTGYAVGTLRNRRSMGRMPPPDVEGDNHLRWRLSTIRKTFRRNENRPPYE